MTAVIGKTENGDVLSIGDTERRSGLYILGKPGMGKTSLILNLIFQDIRNRHEVFFLDPHGDAIEDFLALQSIICGFNGVAVINPEIEEYTFGINPLHCEDINSLASRMDTYSRAYSIFHKIWADNWGVWLQQIIENTLYAMIEAQEYTLAEIPLFLKYPHFRRYITGKMRHNPQVVNFWREFDTKTEQQKEEQIQAALTRINTLLGHPYMRHIVGQRETTIGFSKIMEEKKVLFVKFSAGLPEDIKTFIGTILVSELLHAVYKRKTRHQFCVFVDEFQNFVTDDLSRLITESRKFGIATTIAHQERYGQLLENRKILGATQAAGNKVVFQLTSEDARELAPEFADRPEMDEFIVSRDPVFDLLHGHANPEIRAIVDKELRFLKERLDDIYGRMQAEQLLRTDFLDDAQDARIDERIAGLKAFKDIGAVKETLNDAGFAIFQASQQTKKLQKMNERAYRNRNALRLMNRLFITVMETGIQNGQEEFADCLYPYLTDRSLIYGRTSSLK